VGQEGAQRADPSRGDADGDDEGGLPFFGGRPLVELGWFGPTFSANVGSVGHRPRAVFYRVVEPVKSHEDPPAIARESPPAPVSPPFPSRVDHLVVLEASVE